jgi:hypothetical protein
MRFNSRSWKRSSKARKRETTERNRHWACWFRSTDIAYWSSSTWTQGHDSHEIFLSLRCSYRCWEFVWMSNLMSYWHLMNFVATVSGPVLFSIASLCYFDLKLVVLQITLFRSPYLHQRIVDSHLLWNHGDLIHLFPSSIPPCLRNCPQHPPLSISVESRECNTFQSR